LASITKGTVTAAVNAIPAVRSEACICPNWFCTFWALCFICALRFCNAVLTCVVSARKIYCSCATVDIIATCEEGRLAYRPHFIAARRLIASSTSASTLSHRSAHCIQYLESVRWANSQGLHLRYRAARMRIYSSGGVRPPAPPEIRAALRRSRVLFPATPPP